MEVCSECESPLGKVSYNCSIEGCAEGKQCSPSCIIKHYTRHVEELQGELDRIRWRYGHLFYGGIKD